MSTHTIRVEMSIPRTLLAQWPNQAQREAGLRGQGLLHPEAEHIRWRVDYVSAGYLVQFEVPLVIEEGLSL